LSSLPPSAAAFLGPVDLDSWEWVPPALSGLAAFLVAMERALNFGARWRYQLAMRAGYEHVLDQIDFLRTLPEEEQKRYRAEIVAELRALRRREGMIPGVGAPVDEAAV
jgi:hypothetical protein